MKFNRKNRPTPVPAVLGYVYDGDQIDEWFEGYDKELREAVACICDKCGNIDACILASENCTAYLKLKEIAEPNEEASV